jgi:hypothetical protein
MKICECGNPFLPASRGQGLTMCRSCVTNRRRFEKKKKSVDYLGGKCVDCGYDRYIEALEFDHKDPSKKEFTISGNHCVSWERMKLELDKCELRCANCHRERHAREKSEIPNEYVIDDHLKTSVCPKCNQEFTHIKSDKRKFCSPQCSGEGGKKIVWPNLEDLIEQIQSTSFVYVSSVLGVCDNSIRKHLVRNGINPKEVRNIKNNKFMRQ